jgi:hypothetical protein
MHLQLYLYLLHWHHLVWFGSSVLQEFGFEDLTAFGATLKPSDLMFQIFQMLDGTSKLVYKAI